MSRGLLDTSEPWALPLAGPACVSSSTRLCLGSGRFAVESRPFFRRFAVDVAFEEEVGGDVSAIVPRERT